MRNTSEILKSLGLLQNGGFFFLFIMRFSYKNELIPINLLYLCDFYKILAFQSSP